MIADPSHLHAFSAAQQRHAADLSAVAADLTAAAVPADAFGTVGAGFLAALNHAIAREASRAAQLADRLLAATSTAHATAEAYADSEIIAAQHVSRSAP